MRILAIRGSNLASLAGSFEVDFENGPLAQAGLFAISGPTGAGKSTLLDALCLALFDRTPRLADNARGAGFEVGREGAADVLPNNDVRAVLRRGASEGHAEVEFIGQDGKRYRAEWRVWKARKSVSGKFQNQEMALLDLQTGQVVAKKKTEVLDEISRRLGLTFDQFRRSVLLAQGDFASFLKAKADERAELLERMTGTEIYGEISIRTHDRYTAEKQALAALELSNGQHQPLDEAARAEREAEKARLSVELDGAKKKQTALETARGWFEKLRALRNEEDKASALLSAATAALEGARGRSEELAKIEAAQPLRTVWHALGQAASALKGARAEAEKRQDDAKRCAVAAEEAQRALDAAVKARDAAQAEADSLRPELKAAQKLDVVVGQQDRRVKELQEALTARRSDGERAHRAAQDAKGALEKTSAELQQAQAWLEQHPVAAQLATRIDQVRQGVSRFAAHVRTLSTLAPQLKKSAEKLQSLKEEGLKAREGLEGIRRKLAELGQRREDANAAVKKLEVGDLTAEREALLARQKRLDGLARTAADALAIERSLAELEASARTASEEKEKSGAQAKTSTEKLEAIEGKLEKARRLAEQARELASLDDHRAKLVDGEPCPLCGSKEHPYAESLPQRMSKDADRHIAELDAERAALLKQHADAEARCAAAERRLSEIGREQAEAQARLEALHSAWSKSVEVGLPNAPSAEAVALVEGLQKEITSALEELSSRERQLQSARKGAEAAQRAFDEQTKAEARAQEALTELRGHYEELAKEVTRLEGELKSESEKRDRCLEDLEPLVGALPGWRERLEKDAAAFEAACVKEAAEARAVEAKQAEAMKAQPEQLAAAERTLAAARTADTERSVAEAALASALAELERLRGERKALLGGRDTSDVEAALLERRRKVDDALERAGRTANDAARALSEAQGQVGACTQMVARCEEALAEAERAVASALERVGIDREELGRRLGRDEAWVKQEREALAELATAVEKARAVLKERTGQREAHESAGRPEGAEESVASALEQAREQAESIARAVGELEFQLRQDDELKKKSSELQKQIAEQRKQADLWKAMCDLIGSADGKRFRVFAQSLTLDVLLSHANLHLKDLAPRYVLERVPGHDLDLQVVDQDMGGEIRSVNSLSGGETFLVSLALALGLSSLASDRVRIESLFIDEGFGTLDPGTLEIALATLDALQASGRRVGLISHVPGLAERIGVQICVTPRGAGRSEVSVHAAMAA